MKQLSTLLIAVLLFTAITPTKAQVNTQDSFALVNLYNSTGGSNWTYHTNWLTSEPVSSWFGITVSGRRVTSVDLDSNGNGNNLVGTIPISIGDLTNLTNLILDYNQLSDTIPSSLGNLTNLSYLQLYSNKLSGSIPATLGNLTNLIILELNTNQLSGTIPSALSNLSKLQILDLAGNDLSGSIPSFLGNLANLTQLYFHYNQFTGTIPSSLGNLANLTQLYLDDNQLSGTIPSALGNLASLTLLHLDNNQLSDSIPPSLGNLTNLLSLFISNNQLTGSIPSSLGNLSKLSFLNLSNNQLSGSIPSSLGNLTNLDFIYLGNNNLSCSIPSSLGKISNMKQLFLENNQLSGPIPSSIDSLTQLNYLWLNNNQFTFAGIEGIVNLAPGSGYNNYSPQASIPLNKSGNVLYVSVGGTPSNNTFNWYRNYNLVATINADSTFTPTSNGTYYVVATNAVATQLTLTSNTISITSLPIKAINLQAKETNGQVLLQWQTIDEINTASFTIQHSTDGATFDDIGNKDAEGSGNNEYSFIDKSPASGINYYRIKAIDKDGAASFSKVVNAEIVDSRFEIVVVPNPVRDVAMIKGSHIAKVKVIDNSGRVVKIVSLNDATNPTIKTNDLAAGIYYLYIKTKDGNENVLKLLKE